MFGFFKSLFRPQTSSETAKERLRLVLLSDHLSLAPEVVECLKADLLAVIRKYVIIDEQHADVTFEHRDREVAMLASIPILSMKNERANERPATISSNPAPSAELSAQTESSAAMNENASEETHAEENDEGDEADIEDSEEAAPVNGQAPMGSTLSSMSGGARRKRRRRKRPAEAQHPLPA